LPSKVFDPNGVPSESPLKPSNITESNLINAYSRDSVASNDINCIVYFKLHELELIIINLDKTYEVVIHFENSKINWEIVNQRVNELIGKVIENIKGSQKINLKIVFNETLFENTTAGAEPPIIDYQEYFTTNLAFVSKVKNYLSGPAKPIPEMAYFMDKLAHDNLFAKFTHMFIISINYESKRLFGRLAKDIQQLVKFQIDDISIPVWENDKLVLKNISTAFFEKEKEEDRMTILGSLISNIYLMFDKQCANFAIFETEPLMLGDEKKAKELDGVIDAYTNTIGKAKRRPGEEDPLNIIVVKIDFKEYVRMY